MPMWTGSAVCHSFKREMFEGVHNFLTHTFKLALYAQTANLSAALKQYEMTGECPPLGGYVTGGKQVVIYPPASSGDVSIVQMENVSWMDSSITARGAMLYNATAQGWPSVFILDFGANRISNAGNFTVKFPTDVGILRIK